jgi:hypothetical protein
MIQLPKQRVARCAVAFRQHRDKREDHGVGEDGIQCVDGTDRDGQSVRSAVRAQQVRGERHAEEADHVSRDQARADRQAAADEWALDRAAQRTVAPAPAGERRRWLPGIQWKSLGRRASGALLRQAEAADAAARAADSAAS